MLCKYLLVVLFSLCYSCFSNLSVFLTWSFAGTSILLPYSPASILQSEWLFPSGKSGHSIAHCKVFWFFPNARKIISRLLSLDYRTLRNFASVYFSNSSLAIFQDNHQVMPNYPQFPNMNFPTYLHTFGHAVPSAWSMRNSLCLSGKFQIILGDLAPQPLSLIWVPLLQGFHNLLNSFPTLNIYGIDVP